jgi:hypothetical protein
MWCVHVGIVKVSVNWNVNNHSFKGEQPCKFFEQLLINIFKLVIIPIVVKTVDHIQNSWKKLLQTTLWNKTNSDKRVDFN